MNIVIFAFGLMVGLALAILILGVFVKQQVNGTLHIKVTESSFESTEQYSFDFTTDLDEIKRLNFVTFRVKVERSQEKSSL